MPFDGREEEWSHEPDKKPNRRRLPGLAPVWWVGKMIILSMTMLVISGLAGVAMSYLYIRQAFTGRSPWRHHS